LRDGRIVDHALEPPSVSSSSFDAAAGRRSIDFGCMSTRGRAHGSLRLAAQDMEVLRR
jgi:hypothetical protein